MYMPIRSSYIIYCILLVFVLILLLWYTDIETIEFFEVDRFKKLFYFKQPSISENDFEFNYDYDTFLRKYNLSRSRFPALPYNSGSTFKGLADYVFPSDKLEDQIKNFKCGQIFWMKTDKVEEFFTKIRPKFNKPYVLITHDSDQHVGKEKHLEFLNKEDKLIRWFSINVMSKHPKLTPIPIALGNEFYPHGNVPIMREVSRHPKKWSERKIFIYINFTPSTNNVARNAIYDYFWKNFKNGTEVYFVDNSKGGYGNYKMSWKDYLLQVGNSQFVISPPGTGIDCHRTWEAFMMGAVPIVQKNELLPLYENMPIIIVDKWEEITRESLELYREHFMTRLNKDGVVSPRPTTWLRYWVEKVKSVQQEGIEKYCT